MFPNKFNNFSSREQCSHWEANRLSSSQEILLHLTAHKGSLQHSICPPPVPCPEPHQSNPCFPTLLVEDPFYCYPHLHQDLPSGVFSSGLPTKIPYAPHVYQCTNNHDNILWWRSVHNMCLCAVCEEEKKVCVQGVRWSRMQISKLTSCFIIWTFPVLLFISFV